MDGQAGVQNGHGCLLSSEPGRPRSTPGGPDVSTGSVVGAPLLAQPNYLPEDPLVPHPWRRCGSASTTSRSTTSFVWVTRHRGETVTGRTFRRYVEEVTGEDLDDFFTTWLDDRAKPAATAGNGLG